MRFPSIFSFLLSIAIAARLPYPLRQPIFNSFHTSSRQDQSMPTLSKLPPQFNINSGGPATGRFVAEADRWIIGDTNAFVVDNAVNGGAEDVNLPMYESHRFGVEGAAWGYNIPVEEPGTYACSMHFAETYADAFFEGARVFDLAISTNSDQPTIFPDIDVIKELNGAEFTVLTKTVLDLVVPGFIYIRLQPSVGDAMLSGITCERTADLPAGVEPDFELDPSLPAIPSSGTEDTPVPNPALVLVSTELNINVGGSALGRFMMEDYSWIFGATSPWEGPHGVQIGGAEEKNAPALISQRYGVDAATWGYRIPIQKPGLYDCSMHFAETDSESFSVGARVFNIRTQDSNMDGIDVFKEAGEAPFTAVVKTFLNLKVDNELFVELTAVTGNSFLSAITCEHTADFPLDDVAGFTVSPQPSFEVTLTPEVDATKSPESGSAAATAIVENVGSDPSSAPTSFVTPLASDISQAFVPVSETPGSSEEDNGIMPSPLASIDTSTFPNGVGKEGADFSPAPAVMADSIAPPASETPTSSPSPIPLDEKIVPTGEQRDKTYELLGKISDGSRFTVDMKNALIAVSKESLVGETTSWAVISLEEHVPPVARNSLPFVSLRTEPREYHIGLQAVYQAGGLIVDFIVDYSVFVNEEINFELEKKSIDNLEITLRDDAVSFQDQKTSKTGGFSSVIGIVVGCVLAALVVIALVALFVVRRAINTHNAAAFDAPPPMTESEVSSVMQHSETGASIEYLDDDSTFTAATSRAGDHIDQVAIDKDIYGRGNIPGAQ